MTGSKVQVTPISVVDAVAASLRTRILDGEFAAGQTIRDVELAAAYAVARPTIRAAVAQLTMTGLLRREANRSAVVPGLSADDTRDLYEARQLVEAEAARRAAAGRLDVSAVETALGRLERAGDDDPWSSIVEADLDFHRALVAAARSARLLRLFALLEDEIRLALAQLRPAYASRGPLVAEHRELLQMVRAGDPDVAADGVRAHLAQALSDLGLAG